MTGAQIIVILIYSDEIAEEMNNPKVITENSHKF